MKHTIIIFFALLLSAGSLAAQAKVLTVDMGRVFEEMDEAQVKREELENEREKLEDEVRAMQEAGQSQVDKYNQLQEQLDNPMLSAERKLEIESEVEELEQDILTRRQDMQEFIQSNRSRMTERGRSLLETYYKKIQIVVTEMAENRGADLVLNSTGEYNAAVIYHAESIDITDEVIARLNNSSS
jgi:Skp family chaperone for outer membrane proteins